MKVPCRTSTRHSQHRLWTTLCVIIPLFQLANAIIQSPPLMVKQPTTEEILFQVRTRQDETDKPFVIECEAEGEPAPEYSWVKNGKEFNIVPYDTRMSMQPGRGTLVITSPNNEDIGQYQCFAKNEWGIATSNSVFVRKSELNSFKDNVPVTVTAEEGKPFKLQCEPPDGWPKPTVHWLIQKTNGGVATINSSRMSVDPEGSLWFTNITRQDASDDFVYACSATALFRNEYKLGNKVMLKVISSGSSAAQNKNAPEEQYVSRKNMVGLRGKKLELWCIYGGTPLPEISWSKKGSSLPQDRVATDNYGKTLVIKHVDFTDEGSYVCDVSNGVGQAKSYSMQVAVHAAPYFTVEPEVVNAAEGEKVEFRCDAEGVPKPEIKWIYNGVFMDQAKPNPRRSVSTNLIVLDRLEKQDTGNYGCNASNALGYVYKDVYVNVLALAPEITEKVRDTSTVDGRAINLTCRVFGAPKPEVKWLRGGQELTGGRYTVQESGDLEIKDVRFLDTGLYSCHATNKFGSDTSNGSLTVKEHTRITSTPEDYEVAAGVIATFRCNAVTDSTLTLTVDWLNDGEVIDFDAEPRFVKSSDYSLTITKTTELDSGVYTCVARTDLDEVKAGATLIVQDVPNAPNLVSVTCNNRDSQISWQPMGDNRAPILSYTIQYNTSFTPDSWEVVADDVPASETSYTVPMSPWSNYTFRVIARNKIGPSLPSDHSRVCLTPADVPYKNPDNVKGRGSTPNNLVITWTPMPELEHNAPKFQYRVYYKKDIPGEQWRIEEILDWRQSQLLIENQPTYKRYRIRVMALNEKGEANVAAKEIDGFSGEDTPTEAPRNFTLLEIIDSQTALLTWNPVDPLSLNGEFKGYKIQTWTENEGVDKLREILISSQVSQALVDKLVPYSKNYVRVLAYNGAYNGPHSSTLAIDTPEGTPGPVDSLEAVPMGSSALLLTWKKPEQPNGILMGYTIYYEKVEGTKVGPTQEREPPVEDPRVTRTKLAGLEPGTKYRVHIRATTVAGEGDDYYIEQSTRTNIPQPPDKPRFIWKVLTTDNGLGAVNVSWIPSVEGRPGSHFYVQYKERGESMYQSSEPEYYDLFIVVRGLKPGVLYLFQVIAVDGEYFTKSDVEEIETYTTDGPVIQATETVATAGWFIGMMLAIAFLLLLLIVVCIVKRNRGGKYAVHEKEVASGRTDYRDETGGFHEYTQPLDNRSGRASLSSDAKVPPESDTDSMAEYGEGDTDIGPGMNEDGSFIGQYGKNKKPAETSSAFATLV